MKLLKRVESIERRAARESAPADECQMCWSSAHVRVPRESVSAGSYIAADVTLGERVDVDAATGQGGTDFVSVVERVTSDAADLGFVYSARGSVVGELTALKGSLLEWRYYTRAELDAILEAQRGAAWQSV